MNDLMQEIAKLEHLDYRERFAEIIKIAYHRNELINLLSGCDAYIYDTTSRLWLRPDSECPSWDGPYNDVLDIRTLAVVLNDVYEELADDTFKSVLIDALTEMLHGTPTQLYYAVSIFCQLAALETNNYSNFADWVDDYSFAEDFHPVVFAAVNLRKEELKHTKIAFIGLINNLYEWCEDRSQELISDGFLSITEAPL